MTDNTEQYKATPEQWESIEMYAEDNVYDACILELRAMFEALEGKYETMRLATVEWGKDVDSIKRWSSRHLERIMALEAAQQQPEPIDEEENDRRFHACMDAIENATPDQIRAAAGLPKRSLLVEQVQRAIDDAPYDDGLHQWDEARAAIREVAAWLVEKYSDTDGCLESLIGVVVGEIQTEAER
jgi:hypothetical protein